MQNLMIRVVEVFCQSDFTINMDRWQANCITSRPLSITSMYLLIDVINKYPIMSLLMLYFYTTSIPLTSDVDVYTCESCNEQRPVSESTKTPFSKHWTRLTGQCSSVQTSENQTQQNVSKS